MQVLACRVLRGRTASKAVHPPRAVGCVFKELILLLEVVRVRRAVLAPPIATVRGHLTPNLQHFIGQAHLWFITHQQPIPVYPQYRRVISLFRFPAGAMSILEV